MHIVIMGCGRVGSRLAKGLLGDGHSVAVVDRDATAFRRLGEKYTGQKVFGVGFDRDTLLEAGIERADAFAAVSSGDNSNIISARVARETFGVANVAARIYDPRRAAVYQRFGIPTVATVRWTTDQMKRRLLPAGAEPAWRDATGTVVLAEVHVDPSWIGLRCTQIEELASVRLGFITRLGEARLPDPSLVLQEGDLVHVMARAEDLGRISEVLGTPPPKAR
ncbi:MAG: TrkA family potassium uptake protein [Frankiaceae bacterium]